MGDIEPKYLEDENRIEGPKALKGHVVLLTKRHQDERGHSQKPDRPSRAGKRDHLVGNVVV